MKRLQRLRATATLRDMVSEIGFGQSQLIQPLFLAEGLTRETPLDGLPGNSRHTIDSLVAQFEKDMAAGVRQFLLFPVPAQKSDQKFAADFVGTAQLLQRRAVIATCTTRAAGRISRPRTRRSVRWRSRT